MERTGCPICDGTARIAGLPVPTDVPHVHADLAVDQRGRNEEARMSAERTEYMGWPVASMEESECPECFSSTRAEVGCQGAPGADCHCCVCPWHRWGQPAPEHTCPACHGPRRLGIISRGCGNAFHAAADGPRFVMGGDSFPDLWIHDTRTTKGVGSDFDRSLEYADLLPLLNAAVEVADWNAEHAPDCFPDRAGCRCGMDALRAALGPS